MRGENWIEFSPNLIWQLPHWKYAAYIRTLKLCGHWKIGKYPKFVEICITHRAHPDDCQTQRHHTHSKSNLSPSVNSEKAFSEVKKIEGFVVISSFKMCWRLHFDRCYSEPCQNTEQNRFYAEYLPEGLNKKRLLQVRGAAGRFNISERIHQPVLFLDVRYGGVF